MPWDLQADKKKASCCITIQVYQESPACQERALPGQGKWESPQWIEGPHLRENTPGSINSHRRASSPWMNGALFWKPMSLAAISSGFKDFFSRGKPFFVLVEKKDRGTIVKAIIPLKDEREFSRRQLLTVLLTDCTFHTVSDSRKCGVVGVYNVLASAPAMRSISQKP